MCVYLFSIYSCIQALRKNSSSWSFWMLKFTEVTSSKAFLWPETQENLFALPYLTSLRITSTAKYIAFRLKMYIISQICKISVVRRFGGEPQLMSNGNRCLMDLMSIRQIH